MTGEEPVPNVEEGLTIPAIVGRVRVSEACREIGIVRSPYFRQGWHQAFTRFRVGKQLRVCRLELDAAKENMRGDAAEAGGKGGRASGAQGARPVAVTRAKRAA
ncbi:hypothetical protein J0H58_24705 [bacterium]|nr:hypothetical protein [bacterium]